MDNISEKLVNLKQRVINAFEYVSVPKGLLTKGECEEGEVDCLEIRENFTGKEWRTLTPEILEASYDKLPFFSPEAYHCFLPAYLIYSLENFRDNANLDGSLVLEFTGYNFMYHGKDESNHWKLDRYQNFSKKQLYTIYEFIDLLLQKEDYDEFIIQLKREKQFLIDFVEPNLKI